jgi:hypothetical protein
MSTREETSIRVAMKRASARLREEISGDPRHWTEKVATSADRFAELLREELHREIAE